MADKYLTALDQFFGLVPKTETLTRKNNLTGVEYYGEVESGSPIIPIKSKAELPVARALIEKAAIVNNPKFEKLTGLTHATLLNNWKTGGLLTSCNAFVMKAGQALGVQGLGGFNVEDTMIKLGKRHCWIRPSSGEKPQYGDVFETRSQSPDKAYANLHVGIHIDCKADDWFTIEGGQGGPGSGVDRVARLKRKYNTSHMLGWVDMRLLHSGKGAVPEWLVGNWMIYSGDKNYVYSFNRYSEVTQKAYRPAPGRSDQVANLDTGKLLEVLFDTVKLRWDREGGIEVFTYDRLNSCPVLNERMIGVAADGSAMKGVRL
jgi:hypothetical protein